MNRNVCISLFLGITLNGFAQCDLKLEEQSNQLLGNATFQHNAYADLQSDGVLKTTFFLKADLTYRIIYLQSDKYKGNGHVIIGKGVDGSYLNAHKAELEATLFKATDGVEVLSKSVLTEKQMKVDIRVAETGNYQLIVKSMSEAKLCALLTLGVIKEAEKEALKPKKDDKAYLTVEEMPMFKVGDQNSEKFMEWLAQNLKYPPSMIKSGIAGRVYIQFIVNENGTLSDYKIVRGLCPDADQCVIDLMKKCPAWEVPGKQGGKVVPVYFTLPLNFALTN